MAKGPRYQEVAHLKIRLKFLVSALGLTHVDPDKIFCLRSSGAKTRAIARIYSFPRIWQEVLRLSPSYIIEVISERFDRLTAPEQDKVLIHELMHIPKTFSGALVPHHCFKKRINNREVEKLYRKIQ